MRDWFDWYWPELLLAIGSILIIASLVLGFCYLGHQSDKNTCKQWGISTNHEVKFQDFSWGSWDCLTPDPARPGTWISTSNLRSVG